MTSFATCAHVGCYERIPYEPKEDAVRPRYCDKHMHHIATRSGHNWSVDEYDNAALWIKVVLPDKDTKTHKPMDFLQEYVH